MGNVIYIGLCFGDVPSRTVSTMYYFNKHRLKKGKIEGDNNGEILKCFGIIILMSKSEFCKRRGLCTNTSQF